MGDGKAERFVALRFVGEVEEEGSAGDVDDFARDNVEDGEVMVGKIGSVREQQRDGEVADAVFFWQKDGIVFEA